MAYKQVKAATFAAVTITPFPGTNVFDGRTLSTNDLLLLPNQGVDTGVWIFKGTTNPMQRLAAGEQYANANVLDNATHIWVTGGDTLAGTVWGLPVAQVVTVDTTSHKLTRVALPPVQVRAATTANLASLSSVSSLDGVSLTGDGNPGSDLVLLKDQSTAAANGIYWANTSGAMARADEPLTPNRSVVVSEGGVNALTHHVLVTTGALKLGATDLRFLRVTDRRDDWRHADLEAPQVVDTAAAPYVAELDPTTKNGLFTIPQGSLVSDLAITLGSSATAPESNSVAVISRADTSPYVVTVDDGSHVLHQIAVPGTIRFIFDAVSWIRRDTEDLLPPHVLNVKHFGAFGDGAHDDGPPIKQALAVAEQLGRGTPYRGASLFFPAGVYRVKTEAPLRLPRLGEFNWVRLYGEGEDITLLLRDDYPDYVVTTGVDGGLTFSESASTVTRADAGDFVADGWAMGDRVIVTGTVLNDTGRRISASRTNAYGFLEADDPRSRDPLTIDSVTDDTITFAETVLFDEVSLDTATLRKATFLFVPDPNTDNHETGNVSFEDMTVSAVGSPWLWWNFGTTTVLSVGADYRPTIRLHNVKARVSTGGAEGGTYPAALIMGGLQCSVHNYTCYGTNGVGGVGLEYRTGSRLNVDNVYGIGAPTPTVWLTPSIYYVAEVGFFPLGGGGATFSNHRTDGGNQTPEIWCRRQVELSFVNTSGEGKREAPAAYRFERCAGIQFFGSVAAAAPYARTTPPVELTFTAGSNTITRTYGSFLDDGWTVGQTIDVTPMSSPNYGSRGTVSSVTDTSMAVSGTLANETTTEATIGGNRIADGILLSACEFVRMRVYSSSFHSFGDGSAKTIRIGPEGGDASKDVLVELGTTAFSDLADEVFIDSMCESTEVRATGAASMSVGAFPSQGQIVRVDGYGRTDTMDPGLYHKWMVGSGAYMEFVSPFYNFNLYPSGTYGFRVIDDDSHVELEVVADGVSLLDAGRLELASGVNVFNLGKARTDPTDASAADGVMVGWLGKDDGKFWVLGSHGVRHALAPVGTGAIGANAGGVVDIEEPDLVTTTNTATPHDLWTGYAIPTDTVVRAEFIVVATQVASSGGGAVGDVWVFNCSLVAKNIGGTILLVVHSETPEIPSPPVSVTTTLPSSTILVQVAGLSNATFQWVLRTTRLDVVAKV